MKKEKIEILIQKKKWNKNYKKKIRNNKTLCGRKRRKLFIKFEGV
jgi:hypothetical protein